MRVGYARVRSTIQYETGTKGSNPKKKLLPFGHCPKGGGVQPESKSFWVVFFVLLLEILEERGGLNLFQKFWGSFEVVFGYFRLF